ncbi:carbohydrate ABC transporter permease [Paenibacillus lignilyticus]|uniref:Carbohydrate ABC transporter permease n=1 Tax=Paenibacillus lignilyticus TaxID=1172615 RepID=A0ABS5CA19_9BACL|nr:carbohydrate ABC transporter permease [Paenibacillus lignilyticus]MBP3962836.1 carbohydrate ABC transporter permease [Paenibacillus lignilyticus]
MVYKSSLGSRIFDAVNIGLMLLLVVVTVYPLINVISVSLSHSDYISLGKVTWFPRGFNTMGYSVIFEKPMLYISYRNTVLYAAAGTLLTLFLTSLMAYPLTISKFQLKKSITVFLAITMFFSGGMIPTYLIIKQLHMLNTFWVMVVPGCISAYNVIIFRTFFQNISSELRESAYIDGANDLVVLFRIYLPLSKALLATFALFTVVAHWNVWFNALIYLKDENRYPLQMFLRSIIFTQQEGQSSRVKEMILNRQINPKNIQMAAIVITMAPILCIYPFVQKYFVKGVMVGSIKG